MKADGRLFCWGLGSSGQLGDASGADSLVPVQESTGAMDWAQVSAGTGHTCAVKTDGRLFCWGQGLNGRLGNGATADSLVPVQESTGAMDWAQVSAGGAHTCAVKTDGRLFCWGQGLGNGATGDRSIPVQESTGAMDWAQVSAGTGHTCAVKTDGRLFCWGQGLYGRLGNGATANSRVPVQESSGATDWAQVSAGRWHTCAVKKDSRLSCWGGGGDGELGNGFIQQSLVPTPEWTTATNWQGVDAGGNHTCSAKVDGRLFCWGNGINVQLGSGYNMGPVWPTN